MTPFFFFFFSGIEVKRIHLFPFIMSLNKEVWGAGKSVVLWIPCQAPVCFWSTCLNLWVSKGIVTQYFCFHWFTDETTCRVMKQTCVPSTAKTSGPASLSTNKATFGFFLLLFLLSVEVSIFDFERTTAYFQLFVLQVSCILIALIPPLRCHCLSVLDLLCSEGELWKSILSLSCLFHFFALLLHLI